MAVGLGEALDSAWQQFGALLSAEAIPNPQLLQVILLLVLFFVGGRILSEVVLRLLRMTSIDELAVKSDIQLVLRKLGYRGTLSAFIADTVRWVVYVLVVLALFDVFGGSALATEYSNFVMSWVAKIVVATFLMILGVLISERIGSIVIQVFRVGRISGRVDESHAELPLYIVVGKMVKYLGYIVTTVIALSFLGVDPVIMYILVAALSIGITVAFILAAWKLLLNIAISIYFQMSRIFRGGEYVSIDDHEGKIASIRPLYTKIEGDGQVYYIPNTKLISSVIEYRGDGE